MNDDLRKTILLVEDEGIIALEEKNILEGHGFIVLTAGSGEAAVTTVRKDPSIDLVLMDVNLGSGMDGTEAARQILALRDLPVIFLSSHTERDVVEKTEGVTNYGYVVKSVGETVLYTSIKMAFRLHKALEKEKMQEAELRRNGQRFRSITEHAEDFIFIKNSMRQYIFINPAMQRLLGMTEKEVVGKTPEEIFGPEEGKLVRDVDDRTFAGETVNETRALTTGGKQHHFNTIQLPLETDPDGTVETIMGIVRDVTAYKEAEEKVAVLLEEKELILRETHHRMRNNMNVIKSMLTMQQDRIRDRRAREILETAGRRIISMAVLYDKLYRTKGPGEMPLRAYLEPLAREVLEIHPAHPMLETDIAEVTVNARVLFPLGIIVNELLTNAVRHAFPDPAAGHIRIHARHADRQVTLTIADDGRGFKQTAGGKDGFGMQLIASLADQMDAVYAFDAREGTTCSFTFPV